MPIYEYECQKCKNRFEVLSLSSEDAKDVRCPKCQAAEVERVLSVFSAGAGQSAGVSCGPSGST